MGEVKRLRQENLRLKDQIQALSKEVEQMKLLLQQSSIQLAGEPPTDAKATPSHGGEKSSSLLSDKHDELILFKTNVMVELELLGKKIEAVNEKVKNISEPIESIENYSYQYIIKLVGFPELYKHESANDTGKICLEIFKAIGASELTGRQYSSFWYYSVILKIITLCTSAIKYSLPSCLTLAINHTANSVDCFWDCSFKLYIYI